MSNMFDEGYPVSTTRDGIDTARNVEGSMKNILVVERPLREYHNSKTFEPMDTPDYARED